jgi:hypothetical protein
MEYSSLHAMLKQLLLNRSLKSMSDAMASRLIESFLTQTQISNSMAASLLCTKSLLQCKTRWNALCGCLEVNDDDDNDIDAVSLRLFYRVGI